MNLQTKISAGIQVLKANLGMKHWPVSASIRVTLRCNLTCLYCSVWKENKGAYEMSTSELKNLLKEMRGVGIRQISLTGGEALVRDDIGEIIDYAKSLGQAVFLASNGKILAEKIDQLKNLDTLLISIDGQKEFHDAKRGEESFEKVMDGLRAARARKTNIWINTVITKENLNQVDFILDLAEEYGAMANFQILMKTCQARDHVEKFELTEQEIKGLYKNLIEKKKNGRPVAYSSALLNYFYKTGGRVDLKNAGLKCWAGKLYCTINPNGDLYPCAGLVGIFKPTNCLKLGFKKAYKSLAPINCTSCTYTCYIQKNLLFSLNPNSIIHILKKF
jgi:MoaA/NifB/PqqE/SkfB family radical SAM enzyme